MRTDDEKPIMAHDQRLAVYHQPVAHNWPEDPFAQGTYSYIAAEQEEIFTELQEYGEEKIQTLFAPIGKLFFTGEHTTILLDILGTMEAAVESGERTARIIMHEYPLDLHELKNNNIKGLHHKIVS